MLSKKENGPIPFLHISRIPRKTLEPPWFQLILCIVSAEAVVSNPLQLMLLSSLQFLQPPWHLQIQLMVWPLDPSPLHNYIDLCFRSEPNPRRSTMSEVGVLQCGIIRIHTNIIRVLPCTYVGPARFATWLRILMMLHWRTSDWTSIGNLIWCPGIYMFYDYMRKWTVIEVH